MAYLHFVSESAQTDQDEKPLMSLRDWLAVLGASLAAFMAVLDIQVTNASLRELQGALGLELTEGGWISTAYLIAETIMIPLTGYFSQVFGIRRFLLFNSALFILSSILCGLAWNLPSMVAFRCLQGIAGGALIPMAFQILLVVIPKEGRNLGMVIFGLTATLAPTVGPALGGWLTDHFGWRYIFFINLFPGILMMALIRMGLPSTSVRWSRLRLMDYPGVLTLALGLGTLTYVLEDGAKHNWFETFSIQICTLLAIVSLTAFIFIQLTRRNPLLNLKILGERNFFLTSLITLISGATLYGGIFSLSLYLGQVQNDSASEIGSIIMWLGVPQLLVMPLLPWLMQRFNLRFLAGVGLLLFAYSNYLNAFMDFNYAGEQVRLSLLIRALGQPLFMIPVSAIGMSLVNKVSAGNASSIFNMMRNLGGSIGVAMSGTFLMTHQQIHFQNLMEKVSRGDSLLGESLYRIEMGLRGLGFGIEEAKAAALKSFVGLAYRDSYIQAFNDIFMTLALALLFSVILVGLLKTKDISATQMEIH